MDRFGKQRIALRYWLAGAGWTNAGRALAWAEQFHTGVRKDGVTPEFSHQVAIAHYVRTLAPHLRHPEEAVAVALLHDVREDYDVDDAEIRDQFGAVVSDAVDAMTKTFRGTHRDPHEVFEVIAADPVASVVKPADRVHNQQSMLGVFSTSKMASYIDETRELILPALRRSLRVFPDQESAYENVRLVLTSQIQLLEAHIGPR